MSSEVNIREADLAGPDAEVVGALVRTYLFHTEQEKREQGLVSGVPGALAENYRRETDDPASAYAASRVFLGDVDGSPSGVVIVSAVDGVHEIKRLWTDPRARGRGLGRALLAAAIGSGAGPVRLTVWRWRAPAIGLYESLGFVRVDSWDARPELVCLVKPLEPIV